MPIGNAEQNYMKRLIEVFNMLLWPAHNVTYTDVMLILLLDVTLYKSREAPSEHICDQWY